MKYFFLCLRKRLYGFSFIVCWYGELHWLISLNQAYSHARRQWQPTPVLLPGKSHGRRSLVGCSPWAWWAAVHGVTKSQTQLSDFTFTFHLHALEKEMATHSRVLAWRIPGEPGGLPSEGLHRVKHDWSDLAAAAAASLQSWENPT